MDIYQNPIMAGDYADPTIVRVGEDYYMAFTRRTGSHVVAFPRSGQLETHHQAYSR